MNKHFERSWIDTGIFEQLSKYFDITLFTCFENKYHQPNLILKNYISSTTRKKTEILKTLAWITYRNNSSSFKFAIKRIYFSDMYWYQKNFRKIPRMNFFVKQVLLYFKKIKSNKLTWFFLIPFKKSIFTLLVRQFKPDPIIKSLMSNFDIVILHSCMMEPELPIILKSIDCQKSLSFLVLENWDNLTSKQILWIKPDYVGVMGQVDKENVIKIHGFDEKKVFPISLPKFDSLRHFDYKQKSHKEEKTLLYVGFSLPHNEINLLNALNNRLKNSDLRFNILYRPHPAAKPRLLQEALHPAIEIVQLEKKSSLYRLDHLYMADVLKSNLVIGAPTTFMLEVIKLGVPFYIDITDDQVHRTTSSHSSKNYLHMQQFVSAFNKYVFSDIDSLIDLMKKDYFNPMEIEINIKKFVQSDNMTYASRLRQIIDLII